MAGRRGPARARGGELLRPLRHERPRDPGGLSRATTGAPATPAARSAPPALPAGAFGPARFSPCGSTPPRPAPRSRPPPLRPNPPGAPRPRGPLPRLPHGRPPACRRGVDGGNGPAPLPGARGTRLPGPGGLAEPAARPGGGRRGARTGELRTSRQGCLPLPRTRDRVAQHGPGALRMGARRAGGARPLRGRLPGRARRGAPAPGDVRRGGRARKS